MTARSALLALPFLPGCLIDWDLYYQRLDELTDDDGPLADDLSAVQVAHWNKPRQNGAEPSEASK